ncbi:MAG: Gfo/Idh/MocA family oxidoreductase [Acidobacteria bacterium]|nr:Gfo/Idh/MocA family oxidoreductase [Acidobacteriota bacterium]
MARIGIIGTGWGAHVQTPAFREAGLEVVAIAGAQAEKTRKTAAELDLKAFDDWRKLVTSDVDLITITTPPSEHRAMAIAALEAGKHVLSEKPTALDAGEVEEMIAAANARPNQLALIDHELRFLPSFLAARQRLAEDLGAIRYVEARYASPGRGDRTRAWNWWSDASHGGGVLGAIGSHLVDTIRYLVGDLDSVQAMLATIIGERPFENGQRKVTADDFASLHARLANGAVATISASVVASGPDEATSITIHGERGAYRLLGEELLFALRGKPFERIAGHDLLEFAGNSAGGAFGSGTIALGRALKAAIDDGDRSALAPAATFADGLAQQRALDAARRSAANEGRWEKA